MPAERYNACEAESRCQKIWHKRDIFATADPGPRCYMLGMFHFPSGRIHMGHVGDLGVIARYKHPMGVAVPHSIGWNAFGRTRTSSL